MSERVTIMIWSETITIMIFNNKFKLKKIDRGKCFSKFQKVNTQEKTILSEHAKMQRILDVINCKTEFDYAIERGHRSSIKELCERKLFSNTLHNNIC